MPDFELTVLGEPSARRIGEQAGARRATISEAPTLRVHSEPPERSSVLATSGGQGQLGRAPLLAMNEHRGLRRMCRSWAPGSDRVQLRLSLTPKRDSMEDFNSSRTFGGIERPVKKVLPTKQEEERLATFCRSYTLLNEQRVKVIAFVNSRSGGQTGELLMRTLSHNLGPKVAHKALDGEVCDLSKDGEPEATIERLVEQVSRPPVEGRIDPDLRLLVCGGDGTVTWILTALEQCKKLPADAECRCGLLESLPVAIVPLGTGNDLARSLGWGPRLRSVSDILQYLQWVVEAEPVPMDQWIIALRPHGKLPESHKLRSCGSHPQLVKDEATRLRLLQEFDEELPSSSSSSSGAGGGGGHAEVFAGYWQNYFSVGMDAEVAKHVDAARGRPVGRRCFRWGCGKVCYGWQALAHSLWSRVITWSISKFKVWVPGNLGGQDLDPPLSQRGASGRVRQLMFLNINSYSAGLEVLPKPSDALSPPSPSDGIMEVLGVRNPFMAMRMFFGCRRATYYASGEKAAMSLSRGHFMQLDGEPWQLEDGCDILLQQHREVTMLRAPGHAHHWRGHIKQSFWTPTRHDPEDGGGAPF